MTTKRTPLEQRVIPPRIVAVNASGGRVLYYFADRLLAVAAPPRPWDMPDQWRAMGADGRAVEVNNLHEAMRRAQRYAELLVPSLISDWRTAVEW